MGKQPSQKCTTFVVPEHLINNPSTTLLDLYDWNAIHNADAPLFHYLDSGEVTSVPWRRANDATHRAAGYVSTLVEVKSEGSRPLVAIFANVDPITYYCTIVGVVRAGFAVFPISHRNSPEALADLLSRTKANVLLTSSEHAIQATVQKTMQIMETKHGICPAIHPMSTYGDLCPSNDEPVSLVAPYTPWALDEPFIVMHSSGSTAFPKPIVWSVRCMTQWALTPTYGDLDLKGLRVSVHSLPMFHAMGVLQIGSTAVAGYSLTTFKPCCPPLFPTAENVIQEAKATHSDIIVTIPAFVEQWAEDLAKVEYLGTLEAVVFGGAPLVKEVGDRLVSAGVPLSVLYGSTETGIMAPFVSATRGQDWQYICFTKQMHPVLIPQEEGTFELVMASRGDWRPAVVNTQADGRDAYATNDLFTPHPDKQGLWRIHGRADDQIMLSTGEKTNPVPLEKIMVADPRINAAVIFGRGRTQNGVIIDPAEEYRFDVEDKAARERFKEAIWTTVERANDYAPQHSRIYKEMIIFSTPSKPFAYSVKGTARRQAVISDYTDEINALYEANAGSTKVEVPVPSTWTAEETRTFVREVVYKALGSDIGVDTDIFQFGCDSLRATWIYNQIVAALRQSDVAEVSKLQPTCVYNAPTILLLSDHVLQCIGHMQKEEISEEERQLRRLNLLLERYTARFPSRPSTLSKRSSNLDVVLLTGTTGALGSHALRHLLVDPSVGRVYAFNRPSTTVDRQIQMFRNNGLDPAILGSPKLRLVRGDLSKPLLGLSQSLYDEIQDSVTHVIHNAWKVDFNQSVNSFTELLDGLRALVDLCLGSPYEDAPRLLFTSSVGVFKESNAAGYAVEEPIENPVGLVVPQGYPESKWLGERILAAASEVAGLPTVSVRVGQLSGCLNGYWNEKEWFPSIVKSAESVGCLPLVEGKVTWIPCDEAALALVQMRNADEPVLHLTHPRAVDWRRFLEPIAQHFSVPLVPYPEWLSALEQSGGQSPDVEKMRDNPALRLLDFYRAVDLRKEREPLGIVHLDTTKARRIAPALDLPELGTDYVEKWLKAWKEAGFIRK